MEISEFYTNFAGMLQLIKKTGSKVTKQHIGKIGEDRAVVYLQACGYTVLERNWHLGHKEVDIICEIEDTIVIVEVKTRGEVNDRPSELLDYKKKQNLLQAGSAYVRMNKLKKEVRFDLILVTGRNYKIEHIQEAIHTFDV
ncbi:UPF0102 protein [Bacteroidia bacterium]|nr:UPF0102 protein [Bacteroidia bacterium]